MLIDESKLAVDSSFSFANLRKHHTNLKLKLLFKIETKTTFTKQNRSTKTSYDQPIQIVKDLIVTAKLRSPLHMIAIDQSDHPVYGYTSQPQIHKLGKAANETNI